MPKPAPARGPPYYRGPVRRLQPETAQQHWAPGFTARVHPCCVVASQFSGSGVDWWRDYRSNEVTSEMIRQLRTGFEAMLIAKGMPVSGPFDSVEDMTFPEKKTANLVLYPDFDFLLTMTSEGAVHPVPQNANGETHTYNLFGIQPVEASCSATIKVQGAITLTLKGKPVTQRLPVAGISSC